MDAMSDDSTREPRPIRKLLEHVCFVPAHADILVFLADDGETPRSCCMHKSCPAKQAAEQVYESAFRESRPCRCGGSGEMDSYNETSFSMRCSRTDCPASTPWFPSKEDARKFWNRMMG